MVNFANDEIQEANIIVRQMNPAEIDPEIQTATLTLLRLYKAVKTARSLTIIALSFMIILNIFLIVVLAVLYHNKLYPSTNVQVDARSIGDLDSRRVVQF